MSAPDGWVRVCAEGELLPGEKTTAWDGDTPILVENLGGDYFAVEDLCTHEDFDLSAGCVDTSESSIECVAHGARFNLRDGRALCGPAYRPLPCFPVSVKAGVVYTRDDR